MALRKKALVAAVSTLATVALLEGGFRLSGLEPPDPEVADDGPVHYLNEQNAERFHDREWALEKPAGVHRTIALGDSFTMGRRVRLPELFVKRVEQSLNERAPEGRGYEIFNLAKAGWDTAAELRALQRTGLKYQPDSVFVVFFVNDATGLDSNPLVVERMHAELYERNGWLNEVSALYDYIDYQRRKQRVAQETVANYKQSFFSNDEQQAQWESSKAALSALRQLADQRGFKLGLVIFPMLVRLDESHALTEIYELVEDYCASLDIPTLNLLPTYLGQDEQSLWVSPTNAHPNAYANGLAAEPLERFLIESGLVPDPASL